MNITSHRLYAVSWKNATTLTNSAKVIFSVMCVWFFSTNIVLLLSFWWTFCILSPRSPLQSTQIFLHSPLLVFCFNQPWNRPRNLKRPNIKFYVSHSAIQHSVFPCEQADGKSDFNRRPTGRSTKQETEDKIQVITAFRPGATALASCLQVSRHITFSVRGCEPLAQSLTWRTRSPYLWFPETGWPSYTPWHWAARDLGSATSSTHNNCESLRPMVHNYSDKSN